MISTATETHVLPSCIKFLILINYCYSYISFLLIIIIIIIILNSRELNNNHIKDLTNLGKAENLTFWSL